MIAEWRDPRLLKLLSVLRRQRLSRAVAPRESGIALSRPPRRQLSCYSSQHFINTRTSVPNTRRPALYTPTPNRSRLIAHQHREHAHLSPSLTLTLEAGVRPSWPVAAQTGMSSRPPWLRADGAALCSVLLFC